MEESILGSPELKKAFAEAEQNLYFAQREIFYLYSQEPVEEIAREKTIDGNSIVETKLRGSNIRFPIPTSMLLDKKYFLQAEEHLNKGRTNNL